jgi:hypothetical protein
MNSKKRSGWVVFASILMFGIGGIALLAAIADFVNPSWIEDQSILGNSLDFLWYGAFDLVIGLAAIYAGLEILRGGKIGYWLGIIFATLSAFRWFLFMPGAPIWALTMILVWTLVIYGLASNMDYFGVDWPGNQ